MSFERDHNGKLVRIQWDRLCRAPDCVTVDGKPIHVSHAKLEWPGSGETTSAPVLTITQTIMREPGGPDEPSQHESVGYLVPIDLWDEFEAWRRANGKDG